jgi:Tfp pilus assembly protein PilF
MMRKKNNNPAASVLIAMTLTAAAAAVLPACSGSSTRSRSGDLSEIDPALAYSRRQREEAREHYTRATELSAKGDTEGALAEYRKALELDDQLYAAWNNMGQLLMDKGNYADAVAAFQIASGIEPTDPRPLYNTGLAYQRVGWAADAYASYERALERDANYLPAMRGLARSAEMMGSSSLKLLEILKQAQLRERDEQWRNYFRAQRDRVEILIDER